MKQRGLARIWSVDGRKILGCGFLVSPTCVVTCTHLFKGQPGFASPPEPGAGPVPVDFVLDDVVSERAERHTARVFRAFPTTYAAAAPGQTPSLTEDITVLELVDSTASAEDVLEFADYRGVDDVRNHSVRTIGFPKTHGRGFNSEGRILGANAGWLQLDCDPPMQLHFSGGAVWDDDLKRFVGMIVAFDIDPHRQSGFMIPTSSVAAAFPDLRRVRVGSAATSRRRAHDHVDGVPEAGSGMPRRKNQRANDRVTYSLIAHLCDRGLQEAEVVGELDRVGTEVGARAVRTCIIHGPEEEAIHRFAERLRTDTLPNYLPPDDASPMLPEHIEWPASYVVEKDPSGAVHRYLTAKVKAMGLDSTRDRSPRFIETSVMGYEFKTGAARVLRAYLEFWANFHLPIDRTVVVCIGLRYTRPQSRWPTWLRFLHGAYDDALQEFVEEMKKVLPPNAFVVTKLPPVNQPDAEAWRDHPKVKNLCEIDPEKIAEIYRAKATDLRMPMASLAPELERLLKEAMR